MTYCIYILYITISDKHKNDDVLNKIYQESSGEHLQLKLTVIYLKL